VITSVDSKSVCQEPLGSRHQDKSGALKCPSEHGHFDFYAGIKITKCFQQCYVGFGRAFLEGKRTMVSQSLRKGLLISAGILSVGLATAGIFLPLLPTTPFLLLAAACFVRSSDRLYRWLINHKWFGHYIKNYREHKAITRRAKIVILLMLWGTLGYTAILVITSLTVRVLLLLVGLGVTLHILSLKTLPPKNTIRDIKK